MQPLHIETPVIESQRMSTPGKQRVWLKLEVLQPPGSFKIRGIGLACQTHAQRGAQRFISSSGGNAGIAVAYAGRCLGIPVIVVVPETTTERAKALIRQEGADIIVSGASWQEANTLALAMATPTDVFIHPFDDPLLWQGHASLIDEVARSGPRPEAIVLSVGGGGLLSGVIAGLRRNHWSDIPVIAVETRGTDSLAQSMAAGKRIVLPAITSLATTLGARQVCENAFECSQTHPVHNVVVSDQAAVSACQQFIQDHRMVVEPACGAALAVVYHHAPPLAAFQSILVIVCGGATATVEQLNLWSKA